MRRIRLQHWVPLMSGYFLAGCIFLPIPVVESSGLEGGSRSNIEAGMPQDIKVGESTRVDVLLALGAPDDRRDEDSWFRYRSVRTRGGVHPIVVAVPITPAVPQNWGGQFDFGNWDSAKWVVVHFDQAGIVSSVESGERQACSNHAYGNLYGAKPCFEEIAH